MSPLFTIHENADKDLEKLFLIDEDGVAYIDAMFELMQSKPTLIDDVFSQPYFREYDPPIGEMGIEIKKFIALYSQGYCVRRMKFDDACVQNYRVIFSAIASKQPDGTYINEIEVLAVVNKEIDSFNYELNHEITMRIKKDYDK